MGVDRPLHICWMWPPHSNSDHQDYHIFNRGSRKKPSFTTVTVRGPYPRYMVNIEICILIRSESPGAPSNTKLSPRPVGIFSASQASILRKDRAPRTDGSVVNLPMVIVVSPPR